MTNHELKDWRQDKELTMDEMAKYVGVPPNTWRNWERGDRALGAPAARLIKLTMIVETVCPAIILNLNDDE